MLFQRLSHEAEVGIDHRGAQGLGAIELLRFNCIAHSVGMHTQFPCNRSNPPMFGIKVAPDLGADFR
jgi:hypothetical protein